MIVVDTSALLAILFDEPSAEPCRTILQQEPDVRLSAGTLSEALIIAAHRGGFDELSALVEGLAILVEPVDAARAARVGRAHGRWGRGVHPAKLNIGDCFAYALAEELGCPLLYVGDDFERTDAASAFPDPR
jgi:ribonuclease VapC